jgi:hypothetical protein
VDQILQKSPNPKFIAMLYFLYSKIAAAAMLACCLIIHVQALTYYVDISCKSMNTYDARMEARWGTYLPFKWGVEEAKHLAARAKEKVADARAGFDDNVAGAYNYLFRTPVTDDVTFLMAIRIACPGDSRGKHQLISE